MMMLLLLLLHNVASDFQKLFPNASSKLQLSLKGKENWAERRWTYDYFSPPPFLLMSALQVLTTYHILTN